VLRASIDSSPTHIAGVTGIATQSANARDSSFAMSASTKTAARAPWMSVGAVRDHFRRVLTRGRSSDSASFGGATYTAYSSAAVGFCLDRLIADSRLPRAAHLRDVYGVAARAAGCVAGRARRQ
jgi:hypothetical protein